MTWENDLEQFYQGLKPKQVFREKAEIDVVLNSVVVPTLERISLRLKLHAKNVKVKTYRYKANISFEDKISHRSAFGVKLNLKYGTISFPYKINEMSCYPAGINLNSRDEVNEDLIVNHFMKYLTSRGEKIKERMMSSETDVVNDPE